MNSATFHERVATLEAQAEQCQRERSEVSARLRRIELLLAGLLGVQFVLKLL